MVKKVGVLALQGAFIEHVNKLKGLGIDAIEVRTPQQLKDNLEGLIIPGGESTTLIHLARRWKLITPLRDWVSAGRPVWGTCAGLIMLADDITGMKKGGQEIIGGLDITADRNHFGRQISSFTTTLEVDGLGKDLPAIFIRAPGITRVGNKQDIKILATVPADNGTKIPVAVKTKSILATAFHPELTDDDRWHRYFLKMINESKRN